MTNNKTIIHINDKNTIFTLSNINFSKINSCIAALWCTNAPFELNLDNMSTHINSLGIKTVHIIYISENITNYEAYIVRNISMLYINTQHLAEFLIRDDINEILPNVMFITENLNWSDIVEILKYSKYQITVSGGSNNKRHLLSKLDNRLNTYLLAIFDFNFYKLNTYNGFNSIDKNRILPFFDFSDKTKIRFTHSKSNTPIIIDREKFYQNDNKIPNNTETDENIELINNLVPDNENTIVRHNKKKVLSNIYINNSIKKKSFHTSSRCLEEKDSYIFSYLNDIERMLGDKNLDPNTVQLKMETSWIELMKEKLDDPKAYSWSILPSIIKQAVNILENHNLKGITKRRFKQFNSELLDCKSEIMLLTISMLITSYSKLSLTNLSIQLGERVTFLIFKKYNMESWSSDSRMDKFNKWKIEKSLYSKKDFIKLGDYLINIFSNEPIAMFEIDLKDEEDDYDISAVKILKISEEYIDKIKDDLIVHPSSLPMICKPNNWSSNSFGGFLLNKEDRNDLVIGNREHLHKLSKNDYLYIAINQINSIKFSINLDLFNYIKNNKYIIEKEVDVKTKLQQDITIRIAEIFSKTSFYLNVNCDWRGRIYTNSFFLSYQGSDLSRSLIQFNEGEPINDVGKKYLNICGANFYGNNINKLSNNNRIKWVEKNKLLITSLDPNFISQAADKLQFLSFCLTMRKIEENINYKVKLPIILDATCSGLQHMAALLQDSHIGALVNLTSKNDDDLASDIYKELVNPINVKINMFGKVKSNFHPLLINVELTRDILKPSIMTQVYNVTVNGIFRQLASKFEKVNVKTSIEGKIKSLTKYKVPCKNNKFKILDGSDLFAIAGLIKDVSLDVYPSLRHIYNYLINITRLLVTLNLPVVWITPVGTKITQEYLKSQSEKISLSYFGKTRTQVIRTQTGLINKSKQTQAIIPNIIHSLDSSHLVKIINVAKSNNILSVITVHDCFGTHPNNMESLSTIVRYEFVKLYTEEDFLLKYHERVIELIKDNNYLISEKDGIKYVISNKDKKIHIPSLPVKGSLNMDDIKNAKLMIN